MNLLAVETSGQTGSLAIAKIAEQDLKHVDTISWSKKATHSEVATVQLQELAARVFPNEGLKSLTHILVNIGPGSFTGIRVGLNLARTLAYALNLPILGVSSLEVLASKHSKPGDRVLIAIKAIQDFYYCGFFAHERDSIKELDSFASFNRKQIENLQSSYTKVLIEGETSGFSSVCEAADLVQWLKQFKKNVSFFSWKSVKPLYIRKSEAEEKLRVGLINPT